MPPVDKQERPDPGPGEEPRETSGATTALVLAYVREHGGDAAVDAVLRRAGIALSAEELSRPSRWTSYDTRIRLFTAATEVLGDPETMFRVGAESLSGGMSPAVVLLVRALGSPQQVYRKLPRAVGNFSTTSTMRIVACGPTHATVSFRLHDGFRHSRLDCDYARGLIGMVPTIFGLRPATVVHEECESDGHPACVYHLTWDRRPRWWHRRARGGQDAELAALREQLRALQSTAADLVAADDLEAVLHRIVERAAAAVLAPGYLLAVASPQGGPPLVHASGVPAEQVPLLARRLLAGDDLGAGAVSVEVRSPRRHHGRLAALNRPGDGALGAERDMLAAYAGHAAAALDLVMALDEARLEARRAEALLGLAHRLSAAPDAEAVCREVASALPGVVGSTSASVLLWDPAAGALRTAASEGLALEATQVLARAVLTAEEIPELVGMLTDREPRFLTVGASSPVLDELLARLGVAQVVAVPLLAGTTLLGVATASWAAGAPVPSRDGDVLARLRGVGDQGATALQKARLLETVRHQATHDTLTGLPGRGLLLERLERALATNPADRHVAVLFCDLDGFKQVNDTLGHAAGDELLRQVSARLRGAIRPGDVVGRLSGDEFAVVLPRLSAPEDAAQVVERIHAGFAEPFRLGNRRVGVGTSVGVGVHSGEHGAADEVLGAADADMYRHKRLRRSEGPVPAGGPPAR
ncbi:diguanylate cyclase domain-containing protein [Trujillonella humicola]|uniref:diguanylate cyclase domain-containing protein n=1 Tax=Trujillonella humicola TaxID=3383699 RepID=UPI0039058907